MVRSAAKNHKHVSVLTDPNQYGIFLEALKGNISVTVEELRPNLARAAFQHTAEYDAAIHAWMYEDYSKAEANGEYDELVEVRANILTQKEQS